MNITLGTLLEDGIIDKGTISALYSRSPDGSLIQIWKGRTEDVSSFSENYSFSGFVGESYISGFNREKFGILVESKVVDFDKLDYSNDKELANKYKILLRKFDSNAMEAAALCFINHLKKNDVEEDRANRIIKKAFSEWFIEAHGLDDWKRHVEDGKKYFDFDEGSDDYVDCNVKKVYENGQMNESLEMFLARPSVFFKKDIVLYRSSDPGMKEISPSFINIGTKISKERISSYWTDSKAVAMLYAILPSILSNPKLSFFGNKKDKFLLQDLDETYKNYPNCFFYGNGNPYSGRVLIDYSSKSPESWKLAVYVDDNFGKDDFMSMVKNDCGMSVYVKDFSGKEKSSLKIGSSSKTREFTIDSSVNPDKEIGIFEFMRENKDNLEFVSDQKEFDAIQKKTSAAYPYIPDMSFFEKILKYKDSKSDNLTQYLTKKGMHSTHLASDMLIRDIKTGKALPSEVLIIGNPRFGENGDSVVYSASECVKESIQKISQKSLRYVVLFGDVFGDGVPDGAKIGILNALDRSFRSSRLPVSPNTLATILSTGKKEDAKTLDSCSFTDIIPADLYLTTKDSKSFTTSEKSDYVVKLLSDLI